MASTGLIAGVNPYLKGNVAVDITSKPLQYMLAEKAKQDAKAEAVDKYYKDYEKSLNTAGLTPAELKIFTDKLNEVKGYSIKNRDQINDPSRYGYDAQSTVDAGFRQLSNYLSEAKQAAGERKAFKTFHDQQIGGGKHVSDNYLDVWSKAMLPVGAGYEAPDMGKIKYFDPFNDTKFAKNVTYGIKPMEDTQETRIYDNKVDTGFNKKTKYNILPLTEAKKLADQGLAEWESSDGAKEAFAAMSKDKNLVDRLNTRFGQVYKTVDPVSGKEIVPEIKTIQDFARAMGLDKIPEKAIVATENVLNDTGKFRIWKKQHDITKEDSKGFNNELLKALRIQGDQDIFDKAIGGYTTNEKITEVPGALKLDLPQEITEKYSKDEVVGSINKLNQEMGKSAPKTKLVPQFVITPDNTLLYALPLINKDGDLVPGKYDWAHPHNDTYGLKSKIATHAVGSDRTSQITNNSNVKKAAIIHNLRDNN